MSWSCGLSILSVVRLQPLNGTERGEISRRGKLSLRTSIRRCWSSACLRRMRASMCAWPTITWAVYATPSLSRSKVRTTVYKTKLCKSCVCCQANSMSRVAQRLLTGWTNLPTWCWPRMRTADWCAGPTGIPNQISSG